jgi:poly(3-hydroxybutyrate) depolymerase
VAIHEITKVTKPFCKLIRFKRFSDDVETIKKLKGDPSVLIVAPLSGHRNSIARHRSHTFARPQGIHH